MTDIVSEIILTIDGAARGRNRQPITAILAPNSWNG